MGTWTDKKIEKLKMLWEKGVSTAEIGKRLDFSKNAIVGKVHRLGLSNRNSPIKNTSTKMSPKIEKDKKTVAKIDVVSAKTVKKNKVKETKISQSKLDTNFEKIGLRIESQKNLVNLRQKKQSSEGVALIDLGTDCCCWPIDDANSGNFSFCGKKVFKNRPYCLEHCALAYTTTSSNTQTKSTTKKEKETE